MPPYGEKKKKKGTYWHSLALVERLWRLNSVCEYSAWCIRVATVTVGPSAGTDFYEHCM